jgi:6-phosphogluconolactonase
MPTLTTRRFASRAALDGALEQRLGAAFAAPGTSAVMLSGGATPLPAYRALAQQRPPRGAGLHVLFSDERYVPVESADSNYHRARPLLDALALPVSAVARVHTGLLLEEAALDYERQLAALLGSGVRVGLGLLGLGADGHTASLFDASDLERARGHLAVHVRRPDRLSAVSVTPEFLAHVEEPLFVVAGRSKSTALARLIAQDPQLTAWRAVAGCARVELWMEDGAQDP